MTSKPKNTKPSEKPVWFITGCSTGFGRQIAKHVLELGYRAVVTARDPDDVRELAELGDALVLKLDVTDRSQAEEAVNPPHRLLLGNDAYDGAIAKLHELREEFIHWEEVYAELIFLKQRLPCWHDSRWSGRGHVPRKPSKYLTSKGS